MRILLVEDNRQMADWLARILRHEHYVVDCVHDGVDADHALTTQDYALVILDLQLPKLDGLEVLRRLRRRGSQVPVIVLTANASLEGRITGLDEGADDYLAKPFELGELEARIRAQLRRASNRVSPRISCGDLVLDTNTRQFALRDQPLALTPREYSVLEHLLVNADRTIAKSALSDSIFGFDDDADPSAVEIYVHRVRKKLDGSNVRIVTFRGLGYLLRSHDAAAEAPTGSEARS